MNQNFEIIGSHFINKFKAFIKKRWKVLIPCVLDGNAMITKGGITFEMVWTVFCGVNDGADSKLSQQFFIAGIFAGSNEETIRNLRCL